MHPVVIAFAVALPSAFAAGVVFHKYVISEAESIKQHVTDEVDELRTDFELLVKKVAAKV